MKEGVVPVEIVVIGEVLLGVHAKSIGIQESIFNTRYIRRVLC
jgi:hypothetical protein